MPLPPAPARALIFDFDGLIADTESAIYDAWRELYRSQGHDLVLEEYVRCVGSTFGQYDPMSALEQRLGRALDWPPLLEKKDTYIREAHQGLQPLPGVRALLAEARAAGVPCAVASSSQLSWVGPWLKAFGLMEYFPVLWTRDRVREAKPSPELFLGAVGELGVPAAQCVVLEDSRNGLLAAQAAGIPCIIVPSPVTRGSDFAGAARLLPTLEGVPLEALLAVSPELVPA